MKFVPYEAKWTGEIPSDEELKPLDELAEKFRAQRLKILNEGKSEEVQDVLTGKSGNLNSIFGNTVREYVRLRQVVKDFMHDYDRDPNSKNESLVSDALATFRKTIDALNGLYYGALGKNLVDEGISEHIYELTQKNTELTTKIVDLTANFQRAKRNVTD